MDSEKLKKRFKCVDCSSKFTWPSELKKHKASVHSELRPFQCEHCDYSAKFKWTLTQHYATHFPQTYKTQSCPQCPYKCSKPANLLTHLRVHTKEKPFACNLCSYRTSVKYSLTLHTRTHTGEKPFNCSLCTLTFAGRSDLRKHKLVAHTKKDVSLVACSSPGCDRKFKNKYILRKHVEFVHNKKPRFSCPHCQKMFYGKADCDSHIRHRHTSERPYKCSVCEYAAATSSYVKKHEKNTHGEYKAVECPVCHRRYKNDQTLAKHHKYAHSNAEGSKTPVPQWKCKESGCTKEYKSQQGFDLHVKSFHLQLRPFKCLYCDHTAASFSDLNKHLKTHTQEKPYSCNQCKRCFISSSGLSAHKATAHSELRPFKCDVCIYTAKTKACLKRHQRKHEHMATTLEHNICKDSRGSKKRTNNSFPTKCRLSYHFRTAHFNAKGASIPKTEPGCRKGYYSTGNCKPCFVRLVRKTELKGGPLCETTVTIYA